MDIIYFLLLLLGALCFLGSATGRTGVARPALALLPLGLFFWILVPLLAQARVVF